MADRRMNSQSGREREGTLFILCVVVRVFSLGVLMPLLRVRLVVIISNDFHSEE